MDLGDKILLAAIVVVALACGWVGYDIFAESKIPASDTVVTLFTTEDGCTVRRFKDDRRYRYFATCPAGSNAGMSWAEQCGKNCTTDQTLPTLTK